MPQSAFNKTLQSAFGQPAFGQASALQPAFGKPSFGQPAFGQPGFAQPQLQQQPQQLQGVFGGNQPKPAFGQPTVLGSTTSQFAIAQNQNQNQAQPPPSPFTSYTQQLQSKPQGSNNGNTFAQQSNNGASPFGQANPFQQGQQNQQNQQVQQPQQGQAAPNPFLQTQKPAATPQPPQSTVINAFANPSSQQQQQQQQQQQPTASAFNQGSTFQQQPQPPVTPNRTAVGHAQTPGRTDKKWDDPALEYSPQEIETFRASTFTMGMVPTVAPPKELCM
jgi:nucleoporin NUP42